MEKELLQKADVLMVQGEDPWRHPLPGASSLTKCLLRVFGDRIAVAAPSAQPLPVGRWSAGEFEGRKLAFYNLGALTQPSRKNSLLCPRPQVCRRMRQHMETLHGSGVRNLLLDAPEALSAAKWFLWDSVCYCFRGSPHPDRSSGRWWVRGLARLHQRQLLHSLRAIGPDAVIVTADEQTIATFRRRSEKYIDSRRVHVLYARVEEPSFHPESRFVDAADEHWVMDLARDIGRIWKPLASGDRQPISEAA